MRLRNPRNSFYSLAMPSHQVVTLGRHIYHRLRVRNLRFRAGGSLRRGTLRVDVFGKLAPLVPAMGLLFAFLAALRQRDDRAVLVNARVFTGGMGRQ